MIKLKDIIEKKKKNDDNKIIMLPELEMTRKKLIQYLEKLYKIKLK